VKEMSESKSDSAQKLLNALINKMEDMDNRMVSMEREMNSPHKILKKAGYVTMRTPMTEISLNDGFRGEVATDDQILKSPQKEYSNEEIHKMSWEEIHEMASDYEERKELY
tara:strand:+ start:90 stop:422 length:333 start_codon:yes stop_codon:yes gene_type:complete